MKENDFTPLADEFTRSLKIRNLAERTIMGVGWRLDKFFSYLETQGVTHIDTITKEVISETNGTWNRVTVWRADGRALYDASFGPGERIPAKNMRELHESKGPANGANGCQKLKWRGEEAL